MVTRYISEADHINCETTRSDKGRIHTEDTEDLRVEDLLIYHRNLVSHIKIISTAGTVHVLFVVSHI